MSEKKKSLGRLFLDGIWGSNPVLRLALGICPAIAVTTTGYKGLAMGLATAAVLVCAELLCSILGRFIAGEVRVPAFMALIAGLAVGAEMVLKANWPGLNASLGIFVPLIAANTLLLIRADSFAAEVDPVSAVLDAVGMGIGYICALTLLGVAREMLAFGTAFGVRVFSAGYDGNALALLPAGGFLLLGLAMGIFNAIVGKRDEGKEDATT